MRHATYGRRFALLTCLALAVAVSAAGSLLVALAQPVAAQALKPWRNALIEPKADAGFFLMAARRGFFEKEGLKVDTLKVKDDTIGFKALLAGEVDSHLGTSGALAAVARGADVKFVGCPWHGIPYVILGRPGLTSFADLRGKSIAASAPGTPPDMVAKAALAMFKLPQSAVKLAAVGADRERFNALLGGVVDAAVVSNEYLPLPAAKSLNVLLEGRQALPKSVRFCVLMTGKTLRDRREDAIRFMMAEIKSFRYALAHREDTIKVTQDGTEAKADDPRPAFVFDDAVRTGVVEPDFPIPVENLVWMQQQLVELGQITKSGGVEQAVDNSIRAEALKRIDK
jgi:NitT/TauT family transport system substrate-binding protein